MDRSRKRRTEAGKSKKEDRTRSEKDGLKGAQEGQKKIKVREKGKFVPEAAEGRKRWKGRDSIKWKISRLIYH
jgi:hypothetical protein